MFKGIVNNFFFFTRILVALNSLKILNDSKELKIIINTACFVSRPSAGSKCSIINVGPVLQEPVMQYPQANYSITKFFKNWVAPRVIHIKN